MEGKKIIDRKTGRLEGWGAHPSTVPFFHSFPFFLRPLVSSCCGCVFRLCLRSPISFFTGYTIFVRTAVDSWNLTEVAVRYRCRCFPFQGIDVPRILFSGFPFVHTPEEVKDEYQLCESECEGTHRDKDIHIREGLFLRHHLYCFRQEGWICAADVHRHRGYASGRRCS